ncbi:MAG: hypothetical protein SFW64_04520 [Alphaproteobacteria bacterium]|nr:hypothetical protein [Alphaproteobacteria bacterium]
MFGTTRGSLGGLVLIGGLVYFTGAGNWALNNLKGLDANCYSGLSRLGTSVANPVCSGLAKGMEAIDKAATAASVQIDGWKRDLLGMDGFSKLDAMAASLGKSVSGLTSPGDTLTQMMRNGPGAVRGGQQPFQQAIDTFAIGQGLLGQGGATAQAVPWFQQGAQQPQGYGVMSQIALGNLYAKGGQGVPADPQRAYYYLDRARQSIAALSASNNPQAQQMLRSLPASPQKIQADLERVILDLRAQKM